MTVSEFRHSEPGWDMHEHGSDLGPRSAELLNVGETVDGEVVCHHPFGLGAYLPGPRQYGHVQITEIRTGYLRGPADFPAIGTAVRALVLGYTGVEGQLRLSLLRAQRAD